MLRGAAVGLVMSCHAWPQFFGGAGIVGVTMFFALSGYLITGLLLRELEQRNGFRAGRFYMHRAFRLYPALIALEAGYAVLSVALNRGHSVGEITHSWTVGLLYLTDLPIEWSTPSKGLSHLWTLAVEEQFYLIWPFVLLLGFRARRVGLALCVSAAAIIAASVALPLADVATTHKVYESPTTWAIALLMGAAARIYKDRVAMAVRKPQLFAVAALFLAAAAFTPEADKHVWRMLLLGPLVAAATIVLIMTMEQRQTVKGPLRLLFGLGTISYAVYLWNYLVAVGMPPEDDRNMPLHWGIASMIVTIVMAILSWYTVEAAGRALRAQYDRRSQSLSGPEGAAGATTVLVAAGSARSDAEPDLADGHRGRHGAGGLDDELGLDGAQH